MIAPEKLPPAEYVAAVFGSYAEVVRALKAVDVHIDRTAPSHWKARGRIPQQHWLPLLKAAEINGHSRYITPETLLTGGVL